MGRKRKKTHKNQKSKKRNSSIDLAVISCFVIGVLFTILIYAETGEMGKIIGPVLGGIIGIIKYIIPLGIIGIGISLVRDSKDYIFSKICQYFVFLACIAAMMSIFQVSKGNINIDVEFSDALQRSYELGSSNIGGGTIGTVICYPLIKMVGMFGAAVTVTGIAIIMLVFTFGLRPAQFIIELLDALDERKEIRKQEKDNELEILKEERLAKSRKNITEELSENKKTKKVRKFRILYS